MRLSILAALILVGISLAGCVETSQTELTSDALADIKSQTNMKDCPDGQTHEFDFWVNMEYTWQPDGTNTVTGFAFGTSPDGPFTVPAPTIRVTQCDWVVARLHTTNQFPTHTIHWHGLSLPWQMDGVAYVTQDVGEGVFEYRFQATESGTYWYHCHVEAPSHIDFGMYGALIIDPLDESVDMPYDRDVIVQLADMDSAYAELWHAVNSGDVTHIEALTGDPQDRAEDISRGRRIVTDVAGFIIEDTTGIETWAEGPRPYYPEPSVRYKPQYDTFMINGKSYPETEPIYTAEGETIRIRLINSGTLSHTMHLHGHHFLVTHKDGYPLASPYYGDTILVGSGERYDLYVESDNPGLWDFHDHGGGWGYGGHSQNDFAFPGGAMTMFVYEDLEEAELDGPNHAHTAGDYAVYSEFNRHSPFN